MSDLKEKQLLNEVYGSMYKQEGEPIQEQRPDDNMVANVHNALNLVHEISELLQDQPAPDTGGATFAGANDVGYAVEKLTEIRNFLKGESL